MQLFCRVHLDGRKAPIKPISSIRERFGDAMDIGVDFHGRVHKPMAKVLAKALEPFHPMCSSFSGKTTSSKNIGWNGSKAFASTFAIGLWTRP
jgi:hypothetical protein